MDVPEITFRPEKKKPLKMGRLECFSANDFTLTERELQKARKELSETEEKKIEKLKELRNKLANDVGAVYRSDPGYLLRFLRVRKYDVNRAFQNLREGFTFKRRHPETFQIAPNLERLLNLNIYSYLPYTDENGNILYFLDIEQWKHEETSLSEVMQVLNTVSDIITMNPRNQVNGVIGIWDVKEVNRQKMAAILTKFGTGGFSFYMQNLYPWRVKNVLLVNTGHLTRLFYKMVRPFLSKKISERVVLLGSDMTELHQYVNPALLPKKLGGSLGENQFNVTQNILDNMAYIKYDRSFT